MKKPPPRKIESDRVTIRIPKKLHHALKEISLGSGLPLQHLIEMLLEQHVRAQAALFENKLQAKRNKHK